MCSKAILRKAAISTTHNSRFRLKGATAWAALGVAVAALAAPAIGQLLPGPSSKITEFALPSPLARPCEIEFDHSGKAWIEEFTGNGLSRFDPATGEFVHFPLPSPSIPGGIEIGPDNGVWFPEFTANSIDRIDAATGTLQRYPLPFATLSVGPVDAGVAMASDMAAGRDKGVWFSMSGVSAVGRIDIATREIEIISLPTPLSTVSAFTQIIQKGPGNLLAISLGAANKIATIDVFTREIKEYTIPTPAALPQGVTTDRDGKIWFTETGAQKFGRLDVATGEIKEWSILSLRLQNGLSLSLGNPLPLPGPIRQGSNGKIYIAQGGFEGGDRIGEFNPQTGAYKEYIVPTPAAGICDINNSQNGAIWFGEFTGNKIGKLKID